jgi:tetratricopeptide (TPR) repeat protein
LYEHFEPSEQVFVDREEYIAWMSEALERCRNKSVVLHLKGIGGIGKSSLLNHWVKTHEKTIRLDCEQYREFFQRLNILAKGAVLHGVRLQRFDILWQIRQRFVEGVEPVREEGHEWAKEVIMAVPFMGSLASIGSAISAVGAKVTPKLKGRYGAIGKWLQETLGKDYLEQLLEILWKDPRRAEFLYLEALLEDINKRETLNDPVLLLLDHFEYVDNQKARWRYGGRGITETDLWALFLSNLVNCVGVMASRRAAAKDEALDIEESELTELDKDSCIEMLELQGVTDNELQERIVSVSGGNPFVLDVICDMTRAGDVSSSDIEDLRADTLAEVRLKVWRRLFSEAEGLHNLVNRAGLVPYFSERIMHIIAPELTPDSWDRLTRMSFVKMRGDGTFVLHDLAEELVRAELGRQLGPLVLEVSSLLERESEEAHDLSLLGMALSVEALYSEDEAIQRAKSTIRKLLRSESREDALEILRNLSFRTVRGKAEHQGMLGWALSVGNRYAEAEASLGDAIGAIEQLTMRDLASNGASLGLYLSLLGRVICDTKKYHEGVEYLTRAAEVQRQLASTGIEESLENLAETLAALAFYLVFGQDRTDEARPLAQEAVEIYRQVKNQEQLPWALNNLALAQVSTAQTTKVLQEALDLQRKLCRQEPNNPRFRARLAAVLNNLASNLLTSGRVRAAGDMFLEVIEERRVLSETNPGVHGPRLAHALYVYQNFFWRVGQISRAEQVLNDSLQMYDKLAEEEPRAYNLYRLLLWFCQARLIIVYGDTSRADSVISRAKCLLREEIGQNRELLSSSSLTRYAANVSLAFYGRTLRMADAEKCLKKAIQFWRESGVQSSENEFLLGEALNNGGAYYLSVNKISEAKNLLEEATSVLKKHRNRLLVYSKHHYALSLCNRAMAHRRGGESREAKEVYQESLELLKEIAYLIPNRYQYTATLTLNNYSLLLRELGELDEAHSQLSEAIDTQKQLAEIEPQFFEPILAISLNNQGILLADMDRVSDAEDSLRESIGIRRRLVDQSFEMYQVGLASALHNLGILLHRDRKSPEAERVLNEARNIWEQLLQKAPELLNARLGKTLHHLLLILLSDKSRRAEAEDIKKLLSRMNLSSLDDEDLWIEEEEPLHIW